MRIERQRLFERGLGLRVIAGLAKTFHHAIGISAAQRAMRQSKRRIEISRPLKMLDGFVDIFARDSVIDVTAHAIAAAQILFVSFGIRSLRLFQPDLLGRRQFQTQAIANLLRDRVLHIDDVGGVCVDLVAPKQIAGVHVDQLRSHANPITRAQKAGGKDSGDAHLASGLSRIGLHALILNDFGGGPHHQRTNAREFRDHRVGE